MRERVRHLLDSPLRGVLASLAIHAALLGLALMVAMPATRYTLKRGEPLFIELPETPEPPPAGNPSAKSPGPPGADLKPPARPPRVAKPAPPAPKPSPPPRVAAVPRPAPPVSEPPRPEPPAPRPPVAASRPPSETPAPQRPAEPPPARVPEPAPQRAPEVAEPRAPVEEAAPRPAAPAPGQAVAARPQPAPQAPAAPGASPSPGGQQIASVPPAHEPAPVDIRSLGRGGGAGSLLGAGRGGISGEPIPLDSADTSLADYLERLRRRIYSNWGYPCVKNEQTRECQYKSAQLEIEFGILRDGKVQFVELRHSSGYDIYDQYALNAIKLSSPFPAVPAAMMARMNSGSTGVAIVARFNYTLTTTLQNLLR
jgi:TonB family protein